MGDLAASGGYYIASSADEIWAHPATITGSIGIFGAIPTFQNTLSKIGVSVDGVGHHQSLRPAAHRSPARRRREDAAAVDASSAATKNSSAHVAEGRKKTRDEVHAIAQGRVWIGTDAQKNGLVDQARPVRRGGEVRGEARQAQGDYDVERIEPELSWAERSRCRSGLVREELRRRRRERTCRCCRCRASSSRCSASSTRWSRMNARDNRYAYCFCDVR